MTLIVAKCIDGKIRIDSDSKLTYADRTSNPFTDGVLKNLILSPYYCLSYAGTVIDEYECNVIEGLLDAIRNQVDVSSTQSLNQLIDVIFNCHRYTSNQTDFILSYTGGPNKIVKISENDVHEGQETYWIGSQPAFNTFQTFFHENQDESIFQRMSEAFQATISIYQRDHEVGGFQLSVGNRYGTFRYLMKGHINSAGKTHQYGTNEYRVGIGEVEQGSFGFTCLTSDNTEFPAVAAFFHHIGVGIIYCPSKGIFGTRIESENDFKFVDTVKEQFNIPLRGMVYDETKHAFKFVAGTDRGSHITAKISKGFQIEKIGESKVER